MWTKKKAMSNAGIAPPVKRGRGRPRKVDKAKEEEEEEALATEEVPAVVVAAPPTIDLSVCQSCIAFTQNAWSLGVKSLHQYNRSLLSPIFRQLLSIQFSATSLSNLMRTHY